jgi:hypothetical protein
LNTTTSGVRLLLLALPVAAWLWGGCATVNIAKDREKAYNQSVEAFAEDELELSARAAWAYLEGASKDDVRYDRALRLLAASAEAMGLTYAASLWWLDIAQGKRDVELIPVAIRGLERVVMGGPHDDETLVQGFLAAAEFSELPTDIQPFLDYLQGLDSIRQGLNEWGDKRFLRIPKKSRYWAWARYVQAVRQIEAGELAKATRALERLAKRTKLDPKLAVEIHRSLARLRFEAQDWAGALAYYETLRSLAPNDPSLLVEMAWAQFYQGDSRRALGLLVALDAPVYSDLIAPERFLLEALSLRRLCQFSPARKAAVRLRTWHGDALRQLLAGVPPLKSEPLRAAARRRGATKKVADLRKQLEREIAIVDSRSGGFGDKLTKQLKRLYSFGRRDALRREERELKREVSGVAEDLLAAEEGVRLILHELSVALLRGRRRPAGAKEKPAVVISAAGDKVSYDFTGEFWTDELDDLVVVLEDRCID